MVEPGRLCRAKVCASGVRRRGRPTPSAVASVPGPTRGRPSRRRTAARPCPARRWVGGEDRRSRAGASGSWSAAAGRSARRGRSPPPRRAPASRAPSGRVSARPAWAREPAGRASGSRSRRWRRRSVRAGRAPRRRRGAGGTGCAYPKCGLNSPKRTAISRIGPGDRARSPPGGPEGPRVSRSPSGFLVGGGAPTPGVSAPPPAQRPVTGRRGRPATPDRRASPTPVTSSYPSRTWIVRRGVLRRSTARSTRSRRRRRRSCA